MIEQGTEEWMSMRRGKVTASRIADVTATIGDLAVYFVEPRPGGKFAVMKEGGSKATKILDSKPAAEKYAEKCAMPQWGASRGAYMAELIVERLTGTTQESYINLAMQWGIDTEAEARAFYELAANVVVRQVPFIDHPRIPNSGASPDGLVGAHGMVEIKCPNTSTHIDTLLGASVDGGYYKQMQWQMACAEREWCDFVSFDPRMPAKMQAKIIRVQRNDDAITELEAEVLTFIAEMEDKIERLRSA